MMDMGTMGAGMVLTVLLVGAVIAALVALTVYLIHDSRHSR